MFSLVSYSVQFSALHSVICNLYSIALQLPVWQISNFNVVSYFNTLEKLKRNFLKFKFGTKFMNSDYNKINQKSKEVIWLSPSH